MSSLELAIWTTAPAPRRPDVGSASAAGRRIHAWGKSKSSWAFILERPELSGFPRSGLVELSASEPRPPSNRNGRAGALAGGGPETKLIPVLGATKWGHSALLTSRRSSDTMSICQEQQEPQLVGCGITP